MSGPDGGPTCSDSTITLKSGMVLKRTGRRGPGLPDGWRCAILGSLAAEIWVSERSAAASIFGIPVSGEPVVSGDRDGALRAVVDRFGDEMVEVNKRMGAK